VKPTNEALRAWAAEFIDMVEHNADFALGGCEEGPPGVSKVIGRISVPQWGTVQVTHGAAFVEAVIEIPLDEKGEIAE
jgi:hypothetical protein